MNVTYRPGTFIDIVCGCDMPCSCEEQARIDARLQALGRPCCKRHLTVEEARQIKGALSRVNLPETYEAKRLIGNLRRWAR